MQLVTAWVNKIGIRVKKTLLDSSIKSSFFESVKESIIEQEETFEYNSHWYSRSEKLSALRVAYISEKYIMKSTLHSEENSALTLSVDE